MATKEMYMKLALEMAEAVVGQTSPNPTVGCVVVKDGIIIGMGAHMKAGDAHAEVNALNDAGDGAKGADLYVTLEPCSHYGKTPPCTDLIIAKQIRNVYIASLDPNPLVSGRGVEKLLQAGINVKTGICEDEAINLNKYFFHYIKTKKPYVTLKTAVTLDGKTAATSGDSKWITSEASRLDVHEYRHKHDAILAGINTIIRDNPHLTTRLPRGGKNPIRIILDTHLAIPLSSNLLIDKQAPTIIVCGSDADGEKQGKIEQTGATVKRMAQTKIEMSDLLQWLGEEQITSLFVEGGSTVHGSFLESGFFQEIIMYMAPKLLGDSTGFPAFGGAKKSLMAESYPLHFKSVELIGPDLKVVAIPAKCGGDEDIHRHR
ncbi:bifunctional diaminohydroxyphosphoribosylaminopyrimidine deaminase/5-amino-6-(5-phosphoribosylamino)uracil reductase RibD [Lederbergia citrea]|uniref:Riboflavin biosynthesis protein RibD n=1 Tax=Lederbergia citrea TaxID=2833581 RepID=A0A942Z179_9BACI|nr:bifunctional diaminohydroxyphosphoribosylaminopyrimidine deaminase/5-amino-6-(5-phosphoribosylamino)uracil reductase RibD [Lederbergia citrea]MBS4204212.1 bifunctional diaminohydroxyphosphoribosylaminopyrimidine deaminase/5-amino-6-(5-phosphoribosylamino)uracil reductase RibD [Lederbergia citrea]MBS4221203.1 bifunctional diaminohydroxyphosphoribosylaminopyrimidine deaminase/5-amino-6-(5-phosphoribosylamino)uracil reductase RibD [Lederbergia citrea]